MPEQKAPNPLSSDASSRPNEQSGGQGQPAQAKPVLTVDQRAYAKGSSAGAKATPYAGNVTRKHRGGMPLWVFSEIVSFNAFQRLMRFCDLSRKNEEILRHYPRSRTMFVL